MIRTLDNPYSEKGGLAILFGNLAENGCVVKAAGVDPKMLTHRGPAVIFESQEEACEDRRVHTARKGGEQETSR